jgi:hypothetical protein
MENLVDLRADLAALEDEEAMISAERRSTAPDRLRLRERDDTSARA